MAKKGAGESVAAENQPKTEYQVLARKYRPQNFSQLQGQDALVRTLSNAIESGRIAHAFMLTGVRGVGKTTTARIVARALNCANGPTVNPCGQCEQCVSISQDRNMDVLEIDAASKTGVDDIREIIDGVQYAPVAARYKVYIIDEVHMLSKAAFNALLKTLEEPPPHVKFLFATTEIRKVPVTVLSRCQRFDLKRIGAEVLEKYFATLLEKEGVKAEQGALALIARAADGSARDGLSLLDQAISREPGNITEEQVRTMLGLVDRSITLDLFEAIMKGASAEALTLLDSLYKSGADPQMVLQDLLDLTHYLTKAKVSPDVAKDMALPEAERVRGQSLTQNLSIPALTRAWQMLLKGVSEVQAAFHPQNALEMVIIRLIFASDQPSPGDLVKQIKDGGLAGGVNMGAPQGGGGGGAPRTVMTRATGVSAVAPALSAVAEPQEKYIAALNSFADVVALFGQKREALLQSHLVNYAHLVKFERGQITLRLDEKAPANLPGLISDRLSQWTGDRWFIIPSREQGEPTIASLRKDAEKSLMNEVTAHPVVAEVLRVFPGAQVSDIRAKK